MKCALLQKSAGSLCCALLLQCAGTPGRGPGAAGDPMTAAIDRGEDIVFYVILSLQQVDAFLKDARNIAVRGVYERGAEGGGCAAYLPVLNRILATIDESRYDGIPVLDSSNVAWPGVVQVRLGGGDTAAIQLPAITPVVLGVMELKGLCLNRDDGRNENRQRTAIAYPSFGDHIGKIDSLIERVSLEIGKMRVTGKRLQFERALLRISRERSPADDLARDVSGRIEQTRGTLDSGITGEGERALLEYELSVLREEMERVRCYQHPERNMRSEGIAEKRFGQDGEKAR